MFRKMRRFRQALSHEECEAVLLNEPRGVMAVHGEDGYPYAFPMDFLYRDGALYFHCAKSGHKLDAIAHDGRVSFCVMDKGFRKDGEWALNIKSVIVFGRITKIESPVDAENIVRSIGLKYYPTPQDVELEIQKAMKNVCVLRLEIDCMTGKLVNEA